VAWRDLAVVIACAALAVTPTSTRAGQPQRTDVQAAIRQTLASPTSDLVRSEGRDLRRLYVDADPLWLSSSQGVTAAGRQALDALAAARDDGLNPGDYPVPYVPAATLTHARPVPTDASGLAEFDVGLSAAMLRFARDLHDGRVDPRSLGHHLSERASDLDMVTALVGAIDRAAVDQLIRDLRPPWPQYASVRAQLPRFRALQGVRLDAAALPVPRTRATPLAYDHQAVSAYLLELGDLQPLTEGVPSDDTVWLENGIRHFQERHGLAVDGVIGAATRAALLVPQSWRMRQLELALERLRWLSVGGATRALVINIPMFRLWTWNEGGGASLSIGVIVGRAGRTPTPVLTGELREVIFRPYWNVPRSILLKEIFPELIRDSGYLAKESEEIVSGESDDATVVAPTAENLAGLRRGQLRLRQRPGPRNALGLIKFVFPNPDDVYMHATPAPSLFARARRDFSHGCVRVEDPIGLAEWVLASEPTWDRETIVSAMNGRDNHHVAISRPVRVVLFYTTVAVMPDDGMLRFAEDIYLQDGPLDAALQRGR
jgi:murein L,D-transpeptidase YcbB/YkuD